MEYSVKDLAEITKVSVRTLQYYDEIGLLGPKVRMGGGRRCYGVKELLLLNEILFFKEMGLSLKKIKSILETSSSGRLYVLSAQKQKMEEKIERLQGVCKSIDKVIEHYKGKKMSAAEIRGQFDSFEKKMREFEGAITQVYGKEKSDEWAARGKEIAKTFTKEELEEFAEKNKNFSERLVAAIVADLPRDSVEVQDLMREHYDLSTQFGPMGREMYMASRENLRQGAAFYKFYLELHPKFPEFFYEAMGVFAENHFWDC